MDLIALPAFTDNYVWMLHDGRDALVVDPGEAAPVHEALDARGLRLQGILVTHHHPDHVGGVDALRSRLDGTVWGPARERIPAPFVALHEGDQVELLGLRFEVLEVPGHTAGHIAYFWAGGPGQAGDAAPLLFCGDTLFSAGCGRLFEGTPGQMVNSLAKLESLPGHTRVCCTHEYTLANLKFAADAEPANTAVHDHVRHCRALRAQGRPTLPSSIALERRINPFLRRAEPGVVQSALAHGAASRSEVDVFAALREWKNHHR